MELALQIALPDWVPDVVAGWPERLPDDDRKMELVIALARENVRRGLGGPFAAAVFDASGRLVSPGINRVVAANCSVFHAEILAIALAQKRVGRYDLSDGGRVHYDLFASSEPCAMCFGAVPWSGIRRLVCGARDEDARHIGFDEGPKPGDWIRSLNARGIAVVRDIRRTEAAAVLRQYAARGGRIYNAGPPGRADG